MIRTELPHFTAVFAVMKTGVYTVTIDAGHATAMTLSWDTTGEDARVVVSQRSPLGYTLTVYDNAAQAADELKDPPFDRLADAIEFERAIQRSASSPVRAPAGTGRRSRARAAESDASGI
ncbi:MAG: hypothetical protein LC772_04500 [Chloroflexi bacterium]|nr:hypothetical protein [Chloroflexota bacterium]